MTRLFTCFALIVAAGACGDDDSGGGGGSIDAPVDTYGDAIARTCERDSLCSTGPQCGATCCDYGEHCDNGECRCGEESACGDGDYCTSGGPVLPANGCGLFCCGPVSGVGCPI